MDSLGKAAVDMVVEEVLVVQDTLVQDKFVQDTWDNSELAVGGMAEKLVADSA